MTNGGEGRIYWSGNAKRFYQKGRSGAVSQEKALESLRFDEGVGRWRDQRGRFVSEGVLSAPAANTLRWSRRDESGRTFISITQKDKVVTRADLSYFSPSSTQQAVVRITVKLPDGTVRSFSASSTRGEKADLEFLENQAKKNARGSLGRQGVEMSTHAVGQATVTVDYITRSFS